MDLAAVAGFIAQVVVIVGAVLGLVAAVSYLWPRTPVGKAAERYADALEGENEVNRRTIARLEVETADLTRQLEAALLRARQLEADVATAKVENDRLRSENMRLHAKLAEHGLDGDR